MRFDHRAADRVERLATVLGRLMADRNLRDTIAENGRSAADSFRTSRIAEKMLDDFAELTAPRGLTGRRANAQAIY